MALPSGDFSGIVSTADQSGAIYLPLKSLNMHIFIADVSARVMLSQLYQYSGSDALPETYYVFPVPARAAVCSFEMKSNNGVRLKGVVKELSQAKEEYQDARSKGLLTGLLEQFRQDGMSLSPHVPRFSGHFWTNGLYEFEMTDRFRFV
jgi:Vault protein inter-alpha-trypsin domain